jgi:superfamily II DNA or RNA helicase
MQCFIYIVGSKLTDKAGKRKLGLTIHPVHRMRQYDIGDCPGEGLKKRYQGLFLTTAKSKKELYAIEKLLHTYFREKRLSEEGRLTEWFQVDLDEVIEYLQSKPYIQRRVSDEELSSIEEKVKKPRINEEKAEEREEKELMEEQAEILEEEENISLKDMFIKTFLSGKPLRSNQNELWDIFEEICKQGQQRYCGIIQWPTAAGKTFGELILFVLANEYAKKNGRVFRCLLVSPKNDIFNTIIHHIRKLSEFGITVCEGHNAQLSSLYIPHDKPVLLTATHAALTDVNIMVKLPPMEMVHYDEVHRIGGDVFFEFLKERMDYWGTRYLTGTSATPKTANPSQHKKIAELFGDPYNLIHKMGIDDAVEKGFIARPRFDVCVVSKGQHRNKVLRQFIEYIQDKIEQKSGHNWNGGKVIAYLPSREEVRETVLLAKGCFPKEWKLYTAVEDADADEDNAFVKCPANGTPQILFACERYREGSDIQGLEMTCVLMGNTIASNIILQIIGRALRADYPTKEGWCCIFRPSEEGTTEEDVMDQIMLEIMETLGRNDLVLEPREIKKMVQTFMGDVSISGKTFTLEETVDRIQSLYERRTFERGIPKEKYESIRLVNRELGLTSKNEYYDSSTKRTKFIEKPDEYFSHIWHNWLHFLGLDTSHFPQTKAEFHRVCKERGIDSWSSYKQKKCIDLPENPGELYSDWTNPHTEFEVEDENVW